MKHFLFILKELQFCHFLNILHTNRQLQRKIIKILARFMPKSHNIWRKIRKLQN